MRKAGLIFAFAVALSLIQVPKAHASVSGGFSGACGSSGIFYTNLTSLSINFELNINTAANDCTITISWTDASGHAQSFTVTGFPNTIPNSTAVSSSLPANGVLSWSSSGTAASAGGGWQLERAPAQSVTGIVGLPDFPGNPPCGSSGTVYTNLRSGAVSLDLAVSASSCSITVSWTDASGHAQMLTTTASIEPGASTTLPAGGAITWTSTGSGVIDFFQWQIERVVASKLW